MLLLALWSGLGSTSAQAQTPAPWRAFDIVTSNTNETRLIWRTPDNGFQIWNLTDGGQNNVASPVFGPIASWSPVKLGVGGDGLTRLLLRRSDGAAAIWTLNAKLNANLTFGSSTPAYGPYTG